MPRLSLDGAEISYQVLGDGPLFCTLINGYTRPSSDFRMLANRLAKQNIKCLLFDNRGAGDSEIHRAFSIDDMMNDVVGLWDHLGIKKSAVLGISMGGMIAQSVALKFGGRVSQLVLVSTASHSQVVSTGEIPWSDDPEKVMEKMRPYFSPDFMSKNSLLVNSMVKQIAKFVATSDFVDRANQQRDAMDGFSVDEELEKILVSTLVLHGEVDAIVPLSSAKNLAEKIPKSSLISYPKCGHLLLAERPKEFAQAVADFLEST